MSARTPYRDLPEIGGRGDKVSWGEHGERDDLGTLNDLTDSRVLAALAAARSGRRINLEMAAGLPDPPLYGREVLSHEIFQTGRNNWDDRLDSFFPQAGTQWDGFRHVRFREHGFYGGVTADPPSLDGRLGVSHWNERGIIGRGVLLDVVGHLDEQGVDYNPLSGQAIDADLLKAVAEHQGSELQDGDIVCVRTGWSDSYVDASLEARAEIGTGRPTYSGLSADVAVAEYLWDAGVVALAADNPGVENSPGDPAVGSLHRRLLAQLGMPLGELFSFTELAQACRSEGRWTFFFVSIPLNLRGGVGTPGNAVAIL